MRHTTRIELRTESVSFAGPQPVRRFSSTVHIPGSDDVQPNVVSPSKSATQPSAVISGEGSVHENIAHKTIEEIVFIGFLFEKIFGFYV